MTAAQRAWLYSDPVWLAPKIRIERIATGRLFGVYIDGRYRATFVPRRGTRGYLLQDNSGLLIRSRLSELPVVVRSQAEMLTAVARADIPA